MDIKLIQNGAEDSPTLNRKTEGIVKSARVSRTSEGKTDLFQLMSPRAKQTRPE